MLVNILRYFKGYVEFKGEGKYPERFINITVRNGIHIWNMTGKSCELYGCMSLFDYRQIRSYARKSHIKTKIIKRHGLPFLISRYKKRTGLLIGLFLFIGIIFLLSQFVWTIQINGAESISTSYIMSVLEKNGLHSGVYSRSLDISEIQRSVLLEIDGIRWMSINLDGCNAAVEIKEKALKPKIDDSSYPCNIIAKKDGVITSVKCVRGVTKVKQGSAAAEGQLLVSAVAENKTGGYTLLHSEAEILAKTFEYKEFSQNLNVTLVGINEENGVKKLNTADFFFLKFPLGFTLKPADSLALEYREYRLSLNDVVLPVGITQQVNIRAEKEKAKLNKQQAKKALENQIALFEAFSRSGAVVLSRSIKESCDEKKLTYSISYTFEEDIAKKERLKTS